MSYCASDRDASNSTLSCGATHVTLLFRDWLGYILSWRDDTGYGYILHDLIRFIDNAQRCCYNGVARLRKIHCASRVLPYNTQNGRLCGRSSNYSVVQRALRAR
jgi:hypothetical protein